MFPVGRTIRLGQDVGTYLNDNSFSFLRHKKYVDLTFAKKINNDKVVTLLEEASAREIPIMVFVGNRGNIQIHTGNVKKIMWHGPWINVLDPNFNLHLDTTRIAETWVVRKPTEDGIVTAVEVFNKEGEIIVQFFGKRKPGIPELETWRKLVAELEA